jgi:glyceraldehyde 3-phosphate dehydrogenase
LASTVLDASAETSFAPALGDPDIDFVAVNDLTNTQTLAHLLKYDSVLGNLDHQISAKEKRNKRRKEFKVFSQRDQRRSTNQ